MAAATGPAERHRTYAAAFSGLVSGTRDWDAATPVPEWRARDVVGHLVGWLPGFLAADGVELPGPPAAADDPPLAWEHHAAAVQALLDDPAAADRAFSHPYLETLPLADAIDRYYTTDVFLHSWDLARAGDQPAGLDERECEELLAGMLPMDEVLRASGQYGPRVPVPDGAPAVDRLMGFIGRDPGWRPPG